MELHFPFRFRNCLYYTQITFSQFTLEVTMAGIHVPGESSGSYRFRTEFSPPSLSEIRVNIGSRLVGSNQT